MTTKVADRVFLDTNVLLAATDEGRKEHGLAVAALDAWPAAGVTLYASGQIRREYLSVATRAVQQNGLGLAQADALVNVRALSTRLHFLEENLRVADRLLALLDANPCSGKQVHDANVVATMLSHGIGTLVTINTDDFARFTAYVTVAALDAS
jgi:predicted nucleic acid-binding protein